jgi:hypothetical protein
MTDVSGNSGGCVTKVYMGHVIAGQVFSYLRWGIGGAATYFFLNPPRNSATLFLFPLQLTKNVPVVHHSMHLPFRFIQLKGLQTQSCAYKSARKTYALR